MSRCQPDPSKAAIEVIPIRDYVDRRFEGIDKLMESHEQLDQTRFNQLQTAQQIASAAIERLAPLPRAEFDRANRALSDKIELGLQVQGAKIEATQRLLSIGLGIVIALNAIIGIVVVLIRFNVVKPS